MAVFSGSQQGLINMARKVVSRKALREEADAAEAAKKASPKKKAAPKKKAVRKKKADVDAEVRL